MAKAKKKLKSVKKTPRTLTVQEALEAESRVHRIALMQKDTEIFKVNVENENLKSQLYQLQTKLSLSYIESKSRDLKLHGEAVMTAEKSSTQFLDSLKEKYEVGKLVYDPRDIRN